MRLNFFRFIRIHDGIAIYCHHTALFCYSNCLFLGKTLTKIDLELERQAISADQISLSFFKRLAFVEELLRMVGSNAKPISHFLRSCETGDLKKILRHVKGAFLRNRESREYLAKLIDHELAVREQIEKARDQTQSRQTVQEQSPLFNEIYQICEEGDFRANLECDVVEPLLHLHTLEDDLQQSTCKLIQYYQENHGFLESSHPLTGICQMLLDAMRDQMAPKTRVLILASSDEMIGKSLADGTIIISQGLINRLTSFEEIAAILAHEQVHFEKKHHQIKHSDWYPANSDFAGILSGILLEMGSKRLSEVQSDLATTAKLNAIGIDSMMFKTAIMRLGDSSSLGGVVHGQVLERAQNVNDAHYLLDFPSSDTRNKPLHYIPKELRLNFGECRLNKLKQLRYGADWIALFLSTPPMIQQVYLEELVDYCIGGARYSLGFTAQFDRSRARDDRELERDNARKLIEIRQVFLQNCADSNLDEDQTRLFEAVYFCDNLGLPLHQLSYRFDRLKNKKIKNKATRWLVAAFQDSIIDSDTIRLSDISPKSYATLHKLYQDVNLCSQLGIELPTEPTLPSIFDERYIQECLYLKLKPSFKTVEACRQKKEVSIQTVLRYLIIIRDAIARDFGEEKAQAWYKQQTLVALLVCIETDRGYSGFWPRGYQNTLVQHIEELDEQFELNLAYIEIITLARKINSDPLIPEKIREKRTRNLTEQLSAALRPIDENLLRSITESNADAFESIVSSDPEKSLRKLSFMATAGRVTKPLANNLANLLHQKQSLSYQAEMDPGAWIAVDLLREAQLQTDHFQDVEVKAYLQLRFALEALLVVSAGFEINDRLQLIKRYLEGSTIVQKLQQLPIGLLDSLARLVSAELSLLYPDAPPSLRGLPEKDQFKKKHDLQDPIIEIPPQQTRTDRSYHEQCIDYSDKIITLPIFSVLKEKLLGDWQDSQHDVSWERMEALSWQHSYFRNLLAINYKRNSRFPLLLPTQASSEFLAPFSGKLLEEAQRLVELINPNDWRQLEQLFLLISAKYPQAEASECLDLVAKRYLAVAPLDEALTMLERETAEGNIHIGLIHEFIESRVRTKEDFEKCRNVITRAIDGIVTGSSVKFGAYAVVDQIIEFFARNKSEVWCQLFFAALTTEQTNQELRRKMIMPWWEYYVDKYLNDIFHVDSFSYEQLNNGEIQISGPSPHSFISFNQFIEALLSLSKFEKILLLRKFFLSGGGIFASKEHHQQFVDLIIGKLPAEDGANELLKNVLQSALSVADPTLLFKPMTSAVIDGFLASPRERADNDIDFLVAEVNRNSRNRDSYWKKAWAQYGIKWSRRAITSLLERDAKASSYAADSVLGGLTERSGQLLDLISDKLGSDQESELGLPISEITSTSSSIEIILHAAQMMGPVGVRFLQVLGQYIELDEAHQDRFRDVYDSMPGQSKLTAFFTLERLAQTDPEVAHFYHQELVSIDEKIGVKGHFALVF